MKCAVNFCDESAAYAVKLESQFQSANWLHCMCERCAMNVWNMSKYGLMLVTNRLLIVPFIDEVCDEAKS